MTCHSERGFITEWGTPFSADNVEHDDEHTGDDGLHAASSPTGADTEQDCDRADSSHFTPQDTVQHRRTPAGGTCEQHTSIWAEEWFRALHCRGSSWHARE